MDEFSDLDLIVACEPDDHAGLVLDRAEIAKKLGPLAAAFAGDHVGEPRLMICLYGPPALHVDIKVVALEDLASRADEPVVLFERDARMKAALAAGVATWPQPDPQWIEDRFWVWVHYAALKIARGELQEAFDFLSYLRVTALGPLGMMRAGLKPNGVRRVEETPALAKLLADTLGALNRNSLTDALHSAVDAYREVRPSFINFNVEAERLATGELDRLTRQFAPSGTDRRRSKQVAVTGDDRDSGQAPVRAHSLRTMWTALFLSALAALAIKVPALFGIDFDPDKSLFYPVNISFFTLPFVVAYFAWERTIALVSRVGLAVTFIVAALAVNGYPFLSEGANAPSDTHKLAILHLPIALWLAVGVAYVGGPWSHNERRMDFIRFTGEFFIYFVLIALGGGVLIGLTLALFNAIGVDAVPLVQRWIVPCGIAGATVIVAWLVEAKQSVAENMAPVLARIFTPLFALVLLAFVATMAGTGRGMDVERELLIAVDLLLVVVFGLLLYSISAREPLAPRGLFDWIQLTLLGTAMLVDLIALWAIGERITEFGFTPNRLAALGMNLVLLVNLAGSAVLYTGFLLRAQRFSNLWDWQMNYLVVIAGWAAIVAILFPPFFGFR